MTNAPGLEEGKLTTNSSDHSAANDMQFWVFSFLNLAMQQETCDCRCSHLRCVNMSDSIGKKSDQLNAQSRVLFRILKCKREVCNCGKKIDKQHHKEKTVWSSWSWVDKNHCFGSFQDRFNSSFHSSDMATVVLSWVDCCATTTKNGVVFWLSFRDSFKTGLMADQEFGFVVLSWVVWIHSCTEIMLLPLWIVAQWGRQIGLLFGFLGAASSLGQPPAQWRRWCPNPNLALWSSLGLVRTIHALKSCCCHCGSLRNGHSKLVCFFAPFEDSFKSWSALLRDAGGAPLPIWFCGPLLGWLDPFVCWHEVGNTMGFNVKIVILWSFWTALSLAWRFHMSQTSDAQLCGSQTIVRKSNLRAHLGSFLGSLLAHSGLTLGSLSAQPAASQQWAQSSRQANHVSMGDDDDEDSEEELLVIPPHRGVRRNAAAARRVFKDLDSSSDDDSIEIVVPRRAARRRSIDDADDVASPMRKSRIDWKRTKTMWEWSNMKQKQKQKQKKQKQWTINNKQ